MKRNGSIDYLKFLFSIVIVLYHYGLGFWGGYIVVEGFFMITGYLMIGSLMRNRSEGELPADSTAKFVLHKYSEIFWPLLFSAISGFLIWEFLIYEHTAELAFTRIPYLLFEVFPVQVAGFSGFWATGVSWYLSAMLIAVALIHPFAKKDPLRFSYTVAPIASILLYGFLCYHFGNLDLSNSWVLDGLLNGALLRAVADICAGCILWCLVHRAKEKISMGMRIFYTVAELAGLWYLFQTITTQGKARTWEDFILAALIFGVLYLALSGKTLFSLIPANPVSRAMATISTYIYLNHYAWNIYFDQTYADRTQEEMLGWYILCVAASSLAAWGLTKLTSWGIRTVKRRKTEKAAVSLN
ncbi:MAG: acyltransferase [Clostridia bacterium]|nr:acyltransferase [Clostridia bacterium]